MGVKFEKHGYVLVNEDLSYDIFLCKLFFDDIPDLFYRFSDIFDDWGHLENTWIQFGGI